MDPTTQTGIPNMETPNTDPKMDLARINSLRMQNSCMRVLLVKEREKTAYLEQHSRPPPPPPSTPPSDSSEVTAQDIHLYYLIDKLILTN